MVPNTSQEHFCGCLEHGQAVYNDNSGQWTISAAGRPQTRPHSFRHPSKTTRDKSRPLSLAICRFLFSCKKSTTYLTFDPPTRTLRSLMFSPLLLGNVFSSMAAQSNFARKTYNPRHEPPVTPSPKQLLVRLVRGHPGPYHWPLHLLCARSLHHGKKQTDTWRSETQLLTKGCCICSTPSTTKYTTYLCTTKGLCE